MNKVTQRFTIIFIPLAIILILCSLLYEHSSFQAEKMEIAEREKAYINHQKKNITQIYPLIVSDLNFLTNLQEVSQFSDEGAPNTIHSLTEKFSTFLAFRRYYDQVRFIDNQGIERIRINRTGDSLEVVPTEQLQDKSDRDYFSKTIKLPQGSIYASPFDLNIEHGVIEKPFKPIIRFAAPIQDNQKHNTGVLVLNYLGSHLLAEIERTDILGLHGQLLLVNNAGYWLKGLHPEDEWGFMLAERSQQTLKNQFPEVWEEMSTSESGQIETETGIFSYVTVRPLYDDLTVSSAANWVGEDSTWKLISFIARKKIVAETISLRMQIVIIDIIILVLLAIGVWLFVRTQTGYKTSQKHLRDAEKMINQLRESLNNGFVRHTPEGQIIEFNEAYRHMLGFKENELKGMFIQELTSEEPRITENEIFKNDVLTQGYSDIYEKRIIRKDGTHIPVEKRSFVSRNAQGEVESIWAIVSDISQRKEYETKLRLLASVFENTVEGISINRLDGTIEEVNPGFSAITGYSAEEVIGKTPAILKSKHHGPDFYKKMWQTLRETGHWSGEIWNRRKDGESYPERLSINAVTDYKGNASHYIAVFYDISDIKRGEEQLHHLAYYDALTNLPNRLDSSLLID